MSIIRLAMLLCLVVLSAPTSADDLPAPFGLRFGMPQSEITFRKLGDTVAVAEVPSLPMLSMTMEGDPPVPVVKKNPPKTIEERNPLLTQCERAFDKMMFFVLFNSRWLDWALTGDPIQDFDDTFILSEKERAPLPDPTEGMSFTDRPRVDETLGVQFRLDKIRASRERADLGAVKAFAAKGPLFDVISRAPSEWLDPHYGYDRRNWQQDIIAARIGHHRTVAAYETDLGAKTRQMCLVFGGEGLISVYVPHSEIADVWPSIIDGLKADKRYAPTYAEQSEGPFDDTYNRVLAHATWVDDKRKLAVIAYVAGLKEKSWFDNATRQASDERTVPFIAYSDLGLRAQAYRRFKDDVRPRILAEAQLRAQAEAASVATKQQLQARTKAAQDDLIRSFGKR